MLKRLFISLLLISVITLFAAKPSPKQFFKTELKTGNIKIEVKNNKIVFTIPFSFSEMTPTGQTRKALYKISRYLKYYPSYSILIVGHTDNIKPRLASTKKRYPTLQAYSLGRANAAKKFLIRFGLKSNKIKTQGAGDSKPVASNDTAAGRAKNRRVEINVDLGVASIPREAIRQRPNVDTTSNQRQQNSSNRNNSSNQNTQPRIEVTPNAQDNRPPSSN